MAQATGTSDNGQQTLLTATLTDPSVLGLKVGPKLLPPAERLGYYFLFLVDNADLGRNYVIDRGAVYGPGIFKRLNLILPAGTNTYRFVVDWDFPQLSWQCTLA